MIECQRCGIEVKRPGLCADCASIERVSHHAGAMVVVPNDSRSVRVNSGVRRGAIRREEVEARHADIIYLLQQGNSGLETALRLGVSSRTVSRAIKKERERVAA